MYFPGWRRNSSVLSPRLACWDLPAWRLRFSIPWLFSWPRPSGCTLYHPSVTSPALEMGGGQRGPGLGRCPQFLGSFWSLLGTPGLRLRLPRCHSLYGTDRMPPCGRHGQLIINPHFKAKANEAWSASEVGSDVPSPWRPAWCLRPRPPTARAAAVPTASRPEGRGQAEQTARLPGPPGLSLPCCGISLTPLGLPWGGPGRFPHSIFCFHLYPEINAFRKLPCGLLE